MEVEQFSNMAVKYTMEWFLPHMHTHTLEISWDRRLSTLRIQLLSVVLAWWESQSAYKTLQMKFYQYTTKCMYCSTVLKWKVYASACRNDQTRAWCSLYFWYTSTCMYIFFRRVWQHYLAQLGLLFQGLRTADKPNKCLTHTMWKTINTSDRWIPRL